MPQEPAAAVARVQSLDIVRGFCVMAMMMVDWPGSWDVRRPFFDHAHWLGITPPDFIFPTFVFLMGAAVPLSLRRAKEQGPDGAVNLRILRRSVALFAIGYFLNFVWDCAPAVFPLNWPHMRTLGVLQRFALAYPVAAIAFLRLSPRRVLGLTVIVLLGYWLVLAALPVPGFGAPDLARYPEGEITPNLSAYVDRAVLGHHVDTYPFDSEGILSTFGGIASALAGVVAGCWLFRPTPRPAERVNVLFSAAVAAMAAGYLWSLVFPWSKKLWTSSFALYMIGWALAFLALAYLRLDARERPLPRWAERLLAMPRWYGANAIASIVVFTVIDNITSRLPTGHRPDGTIYVLKDRLNDGLATILPPRDASWIYSAIAIALLSLLFRWLYQRRWFLRV